MCAFSELSKGTVIAVVQAYHRGPEKCEGCRLNEEQQQTIRALPCHLTLVVDQ